jgi:hypothetical protein
VDFNGIHYDMPISAIAVTGATTQDLYDATFSIIMDEERPYKVIKRFGASALENINEVDLIQLTALHPSLKVCAGRLHSPRMQDLPFQPGTYLTQNQIAILRRYCINDLDNTGLLYTSCLPIIKIREEFGKRYGVDIRSRSDAQMAEDIIGAEIKRITGKNYVKRPKVDFDFKYKFKTPAFIKFQSPLLNWLLQTVQSCEFTVDHTGAVISPPQLCPNDKKGLVFEMAGKKYTFGIGGLHSKEKSIAHHADENYFIADTDATSFYPYLMLNAGLAPKNLGKDFLVVFNGIVVDRVDAKTAGDIITAECLKIVVNGTFGKMGSMWSIVYAPDLLLQVTLTGQLSILMLAEAFEMNGIEVTSINTDGIVARCHRSKEALFKSIVQWWENETKFKTEEVRYKATYSKDINNYIAVYEKPQKGELYKLKGLYAKTSPKKNAVNEICIDAIKKFLTDGTSPKETISACKDIRKFTTMRAVEGGAVKGDTYLGKIVRWYYTTGEIGEIIAAPTGNKVARSTGAKPCMDLPVEFPDDIDFDWYEAETYRILKKIGYDTSVL